MTLNNYDASYKPHLQYALYEHPSSHAMMACRLQRPDVHHPSPLITTPSQNGVVLFAAKATSAHGAD